MSTDRSIGDGYQNYIDLQTLKSLYGKTVDDIVVRRPANADALLDSIFTEDVIADFRSLPGGVMLEGRAAVFAFYRESMPMGARWTWHGFSNPVIRVEGDHATGEWLLHAYSLAPDRDARILMTIGRYRDEYVNTANGWRQSRLHFQFGFQVPVAEGSVDPSLAYQGH